MIDWIKWQYFSLEEKELLTKIAILTTAQPLDLTPLRISARWIFKLFSEYNKIEVSFKDWWNFWVVKEVKGKEWKDYKKYNDDYLLTVFFVKEIGILTNSAFWRVFKKMFIKLDNEANKEKNNKHPFSFL